MAENTSLTPESETPKESVIFKQQFDLFAPDRIQIETKAKKLVAVHSIIYLRHPLLGILPIRVSASTETDLKLKSEIVTPFDLEIGYPIDERDYDWQKRTEKIRELLIAQGLPFKLPTIDSEEASLLRLGLSVEGKDLVPLGLAEDTDRQFGQYRIYDDIAEMLSKLNLILDFPQPSDTKSRVLTEWDATPRVPNDQEFGSQSFIAFDHFFPVDGGPLALPNQATNLTGLYQAQDSYGHFYEDKLQMYLPAEVAKLTQIKATFTQLQGSI